MRQLFFFIITVLIAFVTLSPAMAGGSYADENLGPVSECELREILGEPPCRQLTQEEAFVAGKTIEALGNIAVAIILKDRYYGPWYEYRSSRSRDGNRWRPRVPRIPEGCFYPRPGVYYNMRQDNDSNGRTVVCP